MNNLIASMNYTRGLAYKNREKSHIIRNASGDEGASDIDFAPSYPATASNNKFLTTHRYPNTLLPSVEFFFIVTISKNAHHIKKRPV